jgi:hypothetical protein
MLGFFVGGLDPVVIEAQGHRLVGEAGDDVPVQIDGVQLDMGDGVQKRDPPLGRSGAAAGHVPWVKQFGLRRAGRENRAVGPDRRAMGARRARREPASRHGRGQAPSSRDRRRWSAPPPPFLPSVVNFHTPPSAPAPLHHRSGLDRHRNPQVKKRLTQSTDKALISRTNLTLSRVDRDHRPRAAARTSSAWPLTLTLFQTRATLPVPSISTVVRSIPI